MKSFTDLELKRAHSSRRTVLVLDGAVVVAYNTTRPYPSPVNSTPERPSLRRLQLPSFESNNVPYLCATPSPVDYYGVFLRRLVLSSSQHPVVQCKDGKYRMEPKLKNSWLSLERILENIARTLILSIESVLPLDYQFPCSPSEYGYTSGYSSRHTAMLAITSSQAAFLALIAHVSWSAILHRARALQTLVKESKERGRDTDMAMSENIDLDVGWQSLLINRYDMHPAWVSTIKRSPLCDFTIPRSGLILHKPLDWVFVNLLPTLIMSNIPVWIIWGPVTVPTELVSWPDSLKQRYGPSSIERRNAKVWSSSSSSPRKSEPSALIDLSRDHPHCPSVSEVVDPLIGAEAGVGYENAQTGGGLQSRQAGTLTSAHEELPEIRDWIQQRKKEAKKVLSCASQKQLSVFNHRESVASSQQCPGKGEAIVYEWIRDDQNRVLRKLVDRSNVSITWSLYGQRQRWFNYVRNEWELCYELDPFDVPANSGTNSAEMTFSSQEVDAAVQQTLIYRSAQLETKTCDLRLHLSDPTFLAESHDQSQASCNAASGGPFEIMNILHMRLGYYLDRHTTYLPVAKPQWSLAKALSIVGDKKDKQTFSVPDGQEASIIQFLMHLDSVGHPHSDATDIPLSLCDLYVENAGYLSRSASPLYIQQVDADGLPMYIIRHAHDKNIDWLLAVFDPCTALLAVRSEACTITELVLSFMQARMPFYTLRRSEQGTALGTSSRPENYKKRRVGLGERPPGHKLDKHDYAVYKAELRSLLDNRRIARSAVKRGGLLSRLVMDFVDECEILRGPNLSDTEHESIFRLTICRGAKYESFYDDDLSDEEISALVGLYSIKSDKHAAPSEQSWWPTLGKFEDSGLNIGIWTPKCEEWFQKRRTSILEGTGGSYNASAWRNALRFDSETKHVCKGAKAIAARFIENHFERLG